MIISNEEYEKPRSVFELAQWVDKKLKMFSKEKNFEEIYFERTNIYIKRILEEVIPIIKLGLYFYRPLRDINITCLIGNQPYDAIMELIDYKGRKKSLKIEVTTTEDDHTTLVRQTLSRCGIVHPTGSFERVGRNIVNIPGDMVDVYEECDKLVEKAFNRFDSKINHGYDEDTIILVYMSDSFRFLPARHRIDLLEKTRTYMMNKYPTIYGVYYCSYLGQGCYGMKRNNDF